ncbi:MAG: putative sulfate exporter family transporter [Acidobacteriia bacterium]|nr:putative sulfate exporter family transporter [Terriglobia bacterium]
MTTLRAGTLSPFEPVSEEALIHYQPFFLFGLSEFAFGVWAGSSIHAVPRVVAAGFNFGAQAGSLATLVNPARVALLIPFLLVLVFLTGSGRNNGPQYGARPSAEAGCCPGGLWAGTALCGH